MNRQPVKLNQVEIDRQLDRYKAIAKRNGEVNGWSEPVTVVLTNLQTIKHGFH